MIQTHSYNSHNDVLKELLRSSVILKYKSLFVLVTIVTAYVSKMHRRILFSMGELSRHTGHCSAVVQGWLSQMPWPHGIRTRDTGLVEHMQQRLMACTCACCVPNCEHMTRSSCSWVASSNDRSSWASNSTRVLCWLFLVRRVPPMWPRDNRQIVHLSSLDFRRS